MSAQRFGMRLKQQGVYVSQKTVARIMKELGLKSRTVKKNKATTPNQYTFKFYVSNRGPWS